MDNYYVVKSLLGLDDGNLPVHKGMRQSRYRSIEKMLDLLDITKRIGPKAPLEAFYLDPSDPEWDDDMNYLYVPYGRHYSRFIAMSGMLFMYIYNFNIVNFNAHWRVIHKLGLFYIIFYTTRNIYHYRNDIIRSNLFDEYIQMRADELIKERENLLQSEKVKKWVWFQLDFQETLNRVHRQSYKNIGEDFMDSELILQDFIRRYTDETLALPITPDNARIGPLNYPL